MDYLIFFFLQFLPDLSEDTSTSHIFQVLNELIQYFLVFSLLVLILSIFFLKRSKIGARSRNHGEIANITNISAVGIIFRYLTMLTFGHLIRSITFPLTSLPGKFQIHLESILLEDSSNSSAHVMIYVIKSVCLLTYFIILNLNRI